MCIKSNYDILVTLASGNNVIQTTVLIFLLPSTTRIRHLCSVGSGGWGLPSLGFGFVLPSSKINQYITVNHISRTNVSYSTVLKYYQTFIFCLTNAGQPKRQNLLSRVQKPHLIKGPLWWVFLEFIYWVLGTSIARCFQINTLLSRKMINDALAMQSNLEPFKFNCICVCKLHKIQLKFYI